MDTIDNPTQFDQFPTIRLTTTDEQVALEIVNILTTKCIDIDLHFSVFHKVKNRNII